MYNNSFMNNLNSQNNIERINNEINNLQRLKEQMQRNATTPTNLTQNFQLASTNTNTIKYAQSINEVKQNTVVETTPYFSNDMSVVWIKNASGEIKTYELNEIIPKDEKDLKIEYLQAQIEELKKGMIKNEYESTSTANESITNANQSEESTSISKTTRANKKSK